MRPFLLIAILMTACESGTTTVEPVETPPDTDTPPDPPAFPEWRWEDATGRFITTRETVGPYIDQYGLSWDVDTITGAFKPYDLQFKLYWEYAACSGDMYFSGLPISRQPFKVSGEGQPRIVRDDALYETVTVRSTRNEDGDCVYVEPVDISGLLNEFSVPWTSAGPPTSLGLVPPFRRVAVGR